VGIYDCFANFKQHACQPFPTFHFSTVSYQP